MARDTDRNIERHGFFKGILHTFWLVIRNSPMFVSAIPSHMRGNIDGMFGMSKFAPTSKGGELIGTETGEVNFGVLYGMGAFRLARDSNLTLAESKQFIETYFSRLPHVEQWLEETRQKARTLGYVETLFGRKRRFPILMESNRGGNFNAVQTVAIVLALAAGSVFAGHVNDSGFWLVSRFFQMDTKTTLKTWTVGQALIGVVGFILALAIYLVASGF